MENMHTDVRVQRVDMLLQSLVCLPCYVGYLRGTKYYARRFMVGGR